MAAHVLRNLICRRHSYDVPYMCNCKGNFESITESCCVVTSGKELIAMWVCSSGKQLVKPPPWALPVCVYRSTVGKEWWDCCCNLSRSVLSPRSSPSSGERVVNLSLLIDGATEWHVKSACTYYQWLLSWLLHKWREGYLSPTWVRKIIFMYKLFLPCITRFPMWVWLTHPSCKWCHANCSSIIALHVTSSNK